MGSLGVPVIDISSLVDDKSSDASKKTTRREIAEACEQWGFFYIINHGVDSSFIEKTTELGHTFFKMPKEFKTKVARREDNFQGFSDSELTKQKVDWKEVFDFTPEVPMTEEEISELGVHGQNQWPSIPQFEETMKIYLKKMQILSRNLMEAITRELSSEVDVVERSFPRGLETSVCRLNYYPKCPHPDTHLGVGPHSDPAILTVLLQDDTVSSLQVEKNGVWHDIPPVPDSFVINIGDMMEVWSNGKYRGPVHRVLANHSSDRFSLPFFLAPAYSCVVRPLQGTFGEKCPQKFKPIHWGHFRKARYEGDYADKGEEIQISHFKL